MDREEVIAHGKNVQNKSLESLTETMRLLRQSREIGQTTAEKLSQQGKTENETNGKLYEISDEVKTASKKIKRMSRCSVL